MKLIQIWPAIFLAGLLISSCSKEDTDLTKPVIERDYPEAYPRNCDTLFRGRSNTIRAAFSDNVELGSFSLNIHHNFDHHTHSTEMNDVCSLDPVKEAISPFLYIREYNIPEGLLYYEGQTELIIPDTIDTGDYHLMIQLTDKSGWQTMMGLSIKIFDP